MSTSIKARAVAASMSPRPKECEPCHHPASKTNSTHSPVTSAPARIASHIQDHRELFHRIPTTSDKNINTLDASGAAATIHIRFISFHPPSFVAPPGAFITR